MKRFELEPGSGLDNGYSAHMAEDDYGDYVLFKDAQALQSRVAELEAALQHIDACCYGYEMLDWTSQLKVTKNLLNIHLEASAALKEPK